MGHYVRDFEELDQTQVALVGGKGANLGELSRIEGVRVPPGFCVTTEAFDANPEELASEIEHALARFGGEAAYAVRSSATAEDSPAASFAGQHDTYLNVVGLAAILHHIRLCRASLFSERAVSYRRHNGLDDRKVRMAVVVQRMVAPQASGVLFTADPITGHRKVAAIEAVAGLGEPLVSGVTNADRYNVREGRIVERAIVAKAVLTDAEVVRLAELGRRIEAHFGCPQDIEWCLADGDGHIVQSRPITTLFPIPETSDGANHVYVSVGHQQMMTDPMKPLGISFWQMSTPRPMAVAAGRLFVDVTQILASAASRASFLDLLGKSDLLIRDAIQTVIDRGDFIQPLSDESRSAVLPAAAAPIETDPAIVEELIAHTQDSIATLKRDIATKSGTALFDFILADVQELRRILFDRRSHHVFMTAMEASWWLNEKMEAWLGEKKAADTLTLSVANNITSEMGLALLDVADVIRPHAAVVSYLEHVEDDRFLDELPKLAGGREARDAIRAWLDTYGMRGVGEIDITRPRWSERPRTLLPLILGNVRNFPPGAARRQFEQGREKAQQKEQELLARLRDLPDGEGKAEEMKRMIDRVRTFIGYREYPKFGKVSRTFLYKQALLEEAARLVRAGVLHESEDIFYFTFHELHEIVRTQRADEQLLRDRKEAFASYRALTPPRVLTSDGEAISGSYHRHDLPAGALAGLPVSAGIVEGRARVILDLADAHLEPADILVTTYTDPSWTPLFVAIKGLVTEVGGLMTHGAVIAREYGLPAVVGVEHATRRIRDGQRIRVDGTEGTVEILEAGNPAPAVP